MQLATGELILPLVFCSSVFCTPADAADGPAAQNANNLQLELQPQQQQQQPQQVVLATCGPCKCDRNSLYCAPAADGSFTPSTEYFGRVQNIFFRGDLCARADTIAPIMQRIYPDAHIHCDDWWLALRAVAAKLPNTVPTTLPGTKPTGGPSDGSDDATAEERHQAVLSRLDELSRQLETLGNNQRVIYTAILNGQAGQAGSGDTPGRFA